MKRALPLIGVLLAIVAGTAWCVTSPHPSDNWVEPPTPQDSQLATQDATLYWHTIRHDESSIQMTLPGSWEGVAVSQDISPENLTALLGGDVSNEGHVQLAASVAGEGMAFVAWGPTLAADGKRVSAQLAIIRVLPPQHEVFATWEESAVSWLSKLRRLDPLASTWSISAPQGTVHAFAYSLTLPAPGGGSPGTAYYVAYLVPGESVLCLHSFSITAEPGEAAKEDFRSIAVRTTCR